MAAIVKGIYVDNARVVDDEEKQRILANQASGGSSSSSSSSGSSKPKEEQEIEKPEVKQEEDLFSPEKKEQPEIQKEPEKKQPTVIFSTEDQQRQLAQIRSQRWYSGDTPTEVEILAQITRIAEVDYAEGQSLADLYLKQKSEGMYAQTYASATSQYMKDLGLDPSQMTPEAIAEFQSFIDQYGVNTASGGVSTAKRNGKNAKLASDLSNLLKDHFDTQEILKEQDEALREASYWIAQGLTDDEIIKKLGIGSGGKYTKLNKLFEKGEVGEIVPTTAAIALGTDYGLQGALYMMRNPDGSSGDVLFDAVNALLGRGVQPTSTPEQIARRTAGDEAWAPYAVGTTMHEDAMLFGMTGFDRKWLDENYARIAASGDPKLQQAFGRISDAVDFTEKAEAEAASLKAYIQKALDNGVDPAEIFTDDLLYATGYDDKPLYPSLQKMYEGQKKLNLVDVAHAVDFDLYAWQKDAEKFYKDRKGTISSKDYEKTISEGLGSNMPTYEGQDELDKEEEENIKLYRQTMDYTNTTPAEGAALTIKTPDFVRVAASVSTGISAGNGGYDEAYLAATAVANDYVGKHYLNAVTTRAAKQAELDTLTKPVNDFVEKWFSGQDADEVVRKMADGKMEMPSDPAFHQDFSLLTNNVGDMASYLEVKAGLEADIANEDTILLRIDEQVKLAEELNVSGKPTQSVMPMVEFMQKFYGFDSYADYAEFGDWQYQVEANGIDWSTVSGELGARKENNLAAIQELDVAIAKAEGWGNDPALIDSMRRARDVYELDNKLIEYALLQDAEGFAEAVKQFDEQEESKTNWLKPSRENELKNLMVEYTRLTGMEMPKDAAMSAEDAFLNYAKVSNLNEDLALKITLMTDNERDTFKYLYESEEYGPKAAEEFFSTLESAHLESRQTAYREMVTEERTEQHPGLMNVLSIAASPIQAIGVVEVVRAALTGDDIDPDSEWFAVSQVVGKVRDVTIEGIVEHFGEGTVAAKVATFGYQVVTSMGDSLAAGATGSGLVTMGLEAFTNTALECAEKDVGTWDTILMSGVNMLAEMVTEKLPFDKMTDAFKNGGKEGLQGLIRSVLAGSASEAPGEALSELISVVGEDKILGEFGRYEQLVDEFYKTTNDRTEAEMMAVKEIVKQIGVAGLAGAFSGGGQNAISYGAGALKNAHKKNAPQPKVVEEQPAPVQQEAPVEEETAPVAEEEAALAEEQQAPAQQPQAPFEYTKPEVATPGALEKKAPANIRMVTALSDAQMEGVGLDKKTATVQGVFEAGGLNPEIALAAAKDLAKNSPMIQKLQQAIQKADESGVLDVLKAFAYRTLVPSTNVDGMTDSDVISAVENDPAKAQELAGAVMNSEIATETVNFLSEMDPTPIKNLKKTEDKSKNKLKKARTRYQMQNELVNKARGRFKNLNEQLKADPSNKNLAKRTADAAKWIGEQQKLADAERINVEAAETEYSEAKKARAEMSQQRANEARHEAKLRVEQRMAERAAMMQQQKTAEEQQRIADEQRAAQPETVAEQSTPVAESPAVENPAELTAPAPIIPSPPTNGTQQADQQETPRMGKRQFANQTVQESPAMPDWLKEEMRNNPIESDYEIDSNYSQAERGWNRIQENGYEQERDRLLQLERFSADDTAEAIVLMAMANHNGDAETLLSVASAYNKEGTKAGKELQVRKLFSKMSPVGAKVFVSGQLESRLQDTLRKHKKKQQRMDRNAQNVADSLIALPASAEVSSDNRWHVPLNEQQMELIRHYGLEKTKRPGVHYNRATIDQRMLEAIIATPNPLAATGNGLNLVQRLEYMNNRLAVVTNADLEYIGMQLGQFVGLGGEFGNRDADLAVARAYEAFANITPASVKTRARAWRYSSMLGTLTSAERNVIGNVAQNVLNATSHGVAANVVDPIVSLFTKERTAANLSIREHVDGWKTFTEETKNTFKDFFVDKAQVDNRLGDKFNTKRESRVFQSPVLEAYRNMVSFLMSIGDRNFWKKAYVNSLAEQQRLLDRGQLRNPDGTTPTQEQILEQAEHDANYATFTEDNMVRDALAALKEVPGLGDVIDYLMPFTGVPTNTLSRMVQYSPLGLATTAVKAGWRAANGENFDQRAFVNGISRGLTGTGLFVVGMVLRSLGVIRLGNGDEDNNKKKDMQSAMGEQYGPYVYNPFNDEYVSLSTFLPAASPLVMGATAYELFENEEDKWVALQNAAMASLDQIFDASYMTGLADVFGGYGSTTENIVTTLFSSAVSQNVPALLSQLASSLDPYVRDTKDKDAIMEALKSGLIAKIPGLRETLPEKVDVTGETVRTKEGIRNFFDPFTTTDARNDEMLNELMRLSEVLDNTDVLPSDALRGRTETLKVNKKRVTLTGHDKEWYKKRYGELWTSAVEEVMADPKYVLWDDAKRGHMISKALKAAYNTAKEEALEKYGPDEEQ